jgi:glycogen synthase
MRILFLINYYQVHGPGGEDMSCRQVITGLKERGHTTLVLTSMHGTNNVPIQEDGICRSLYLEMDPVPWRHSVTFFTSRKAREKHNLQVFERVVKQFDPDIIFIWGIWNLPRSLPVFAEARYPHKVVYRFATYWPTLPSQHELYWQKTGRKWYSQLPKRILSSIALGILAKEEKQPSLTFKRSICVSAATRDHLVEAGIPINNARIIHTGLDAQQYLMSQKHRQRNHKSQVLNLLYAGRIWPEKGVDTAINALEKLVFERGQQNLRLSIVGSGSPEYEKYLHHLVDRAGLDDYVSFSTHVPGEEMPRLLQKFDVLLLPSIWQEPFSRIVLEGMASGLVVVATTTGGTTEIVQDGKNGLLFTPGNAEDLSEKISCLASNPELRQRLAREGQQTVIEGFTMTKMIDEVEGYLQEVSLGSDQKAVNLPEKKAAIDGSEILPTVSVIIPTYNRKDSLREILCSLAEQTYPHDRFEVIVVDDGSTDGTKQIENEIFPFALHYFWQTNHGDAAARNLGAKQSRADILVFLDDDIFVEPDYLRNLVCEHEIHQNTIVVGTAVLLPAETTPLSEIVFAPLAWINNHAIVNLAFTDVYSNSMGIQREAYFRVGMMENLGFSGSSMWCDVDFAYRAHQLGFEFRRCTKAIYSHRDHAVRNLGRYIRHVRTAAYRSVVLFHKYPDLHRHFPMFNDVTPINWRQDTFYLIGRKIARSLASTSLTLWSMQQIAKALEKHYPTSTLLLSFYRYIIGGYIYQGYHAGLRDYVLAGTHK